MPSRTKYSFGAAPMQDHIVPGQFLTNAWRNWFIEMQNEYLVRWDDLRFPSQGINPLGGAADPARDAATGLFSFSGIADNVIAGAAQMPHTWLIGSAVRPHIHLRFPTAAAGVNTRWFFGYDIADPNGNWTNASGTYTYLPAITVANPNDASKHVYATFGDLTMTGFEESAVILWRLYRAAATSPIDDDVNACLLVEFDLHYQINRRGTVAET